MRTTRSSTSDSPTVTLVTATLLRVAPLEAAPVVGDAQVRPGRPRHPRLTAHARRVGVGWPRCAGPRPRRGRAVPRSPARSDQVGRHVHRDLHSRAPSSTPARSSDGGSEPGVVQASRVDLDHGRAQAADRPRGRPSAPSSSALHGDGVGPLGRPLRCGRERVREPREALHRAVVQVGRHPAALDGRRLEGRLRAGPGARAGRRAGAARWTRPAAAGSARAGAASRPPPGRPRPRCGGGWRRSRSGADTARTGRACRRACVRAGRPRAASRHRARRCSRAWRGRSARRRWCPRSAPPARPRRGGSGGPI